MLPILFRLPSMTNFIGGIDNIIDLIVIRDRLPLRGCLLQLDINNYGMSSPRMILTLSEILRQQSSSLRNLDLFSFTGFYMQPLAAMVQLTNLSLAYCGLDNTACDYLGTFCTQLRLLSLLGNWRITTDGFMRLSHTMSELVQLNLYNTNTDRALICTALAANEPHGLVNLRLLCLPCVSPPRDESVTHIGTIQIV